jgi:hypothetical protein
VIMITGSANRRARSHRGCGGIASPLLTGWMLVAFGPRVAFGATSGIAAQTALPLLWTPNVRVGRQVPEAFGAAIPGMVLFVADGWVAAGYSVPTHSPFQPVNDPAPKLPTNTTPGRSQPCICFSRPACSERARG